MITHISIPQYLVESSFCLIVFYLFYHCFLKRETYFQFNRLYLIGSALLSLIIPILNIDFNTANSITGVDTIYPLISQVNDIQLGIQQTISQESNILQISIADVINWIYLAGFFVMTLKLFSGLFKLFGIINRAPKIKDTNHTLLISEEVPAASFFSYIFWNDKHDKSDPIQKTIMDHEMVHVRQWHSLDVIVMEIMVIVKWFNPLIYLFRNSLKKTHEFIADRYVTRQMGDKLQYANILLKNSAPTHTPPISNHFYGNIKERLEMLAAQQSNQLKKLKLFAVIPITLVLFSLFSFDLTERLPSPIKTSFQNIESSVLSAMEQNVISLDMKDGETAPFQLNWSDVMSIKLRQTNKVQDLIFNYSKGNLNKLLSGQPQISQGGKVLKVYIDTVEVVTNSGRKSLNIEDLKDDEFRNFLIDSLEKHDQLTLGLKTFSDTDSLYIKLHIGLDGNEVRTATINNFAVDKTIKWGQCQIHFNDKLIADGRKLNLDESVTHEELNTMLESKLQISYNSRVFYSLPEDMEISFKVSKVDNTMLASIDTDFTEKLKSKKSIPSNSIHIINNSHEKEYSITEQSKLYTLSEFYKEKDTFKDWLSTCSNGDNIRVILESQDDDIGKYEFNLRYRDENEAITAPFPIDQPHTSNLYSNFQVVMNYDGKSFVRMDTKNKNNQEIIDIYKGSESYEIIHVDGFKTKNRVKEDKLPKGQLKVEATIDPAVNAIDLLALNDYYSSEDNLVRMNWGKMVSMANIGNFSIKEFRRSSKLPLQLYEGTEKIDLTRYDLLLVPENGKIQRIRTDNVNTQQTRDIFSEVDVNTSIYIDNIIIDVEGKNYYYPYNFVFTIE